MKKHLLILLIIPLLVACSPKDKSSSEIVISDPFEIEDAFQTSSPVTGEEVQDANGTHFAVMIENSPNARPQTGLIDADIVYEMKTEGNISRYLAFYHDNIPDTVGPVRSSRHYFIPLAEEMNYPYLHFGASTYAYEYLDSGLLKIPHIDGIKEPDAFFRDTSREAPHNAYLNPNKLSDFGDLKIKNGHFTFTTNSISEGERAEVLEFAYNDFTKIRYDYDENKKEYLRFQEGEPHIDRIKGDQISVKNIIFQYTEHDVINDDQKGRIDISLVGEGTYDYYSEGKVVSGTWEKSNEVSSTVYKNATGELLSVNPGTTWIQVVDSNFTMSRN